MESRALPIEHLQSGEFYDIETSDQIPIVLGALLLEHLPNNQAKLMLLSSSNFDRFARREDSQLVSGWKALKVTKMPLHTVYPYQSFTRLSNKILKWPENYEGEELINQIKKEMWKAVSEGCWVFNLPHFLDGYLPVYLSYIRWSVNCPNRMELFDSLFEFLDSFFSVLRAHILRVKPLPEEHIRELLKVMKDMDLIPEMVLEISKEGASPQYIEKSLEIAERKKSYFDSYRPIELVSERFDRLWELIVQEYHQDLLVWQLQEPLSLQCLLLHSAKLIGILSCYPEARDLMDLSFPGLQSEEMLRLKSNVEATANSFRYAQDLVEHLGIAAEELSRIILENELVRPILISRSEKLQDFVMTRAELFPSVLAYLNSTSQENIQINKLLKCATARIAVEDWQFVTFFIEHRTLNSVTPQRQMSTEETNIQIKELVRVAVEHLMSAELLRDLLPCVDYGHLVFLALAERFCLPHYKEMLITYFGLNTLTTVIDSSRTKDILCLFNCLTVQIALEDWEFISLLIKGDCLSPTKWYSLLDTQELYEKVKELVGAAMDHKMSAELLRTLLPCVNYGHLVFPALVEKFHLPYYRQAMANYFRPEQSYLGIEDYRVKERLSIYLRFLKSKIALEDWEFLPIVLKEISSPTTMHSFLDDQNNQIQELVRLSLEHNMNPELLRDLLPCVDYGHLVFPALAAQFHLPHCREVMITYFTLEQWHSDVNNALGKDRLLSFFRCLTTHITLKDWEFVNFVIQNDSIRPATQASLLDNQVICDQVKELIGVSLEHQMSADLIQHLLPCVDYGQLVFPAFAERFYLPGGREVMITYFRPEEWHTDIKNPNAKDRLLRFWEVLTTRIALEDWKFVNFVVDSSLIPAIKDSVLDDQEVYEGLKALVDVLLKHRMSIDLRRYLLPCENFGHLVFPILVEKLTFPKCRVVAINYFRSDIWHPDTNLFKAKDRLLNVWMSLFLQMLKKPESFDTLQDQKWDESFHEIVGVALDFKICAELLRSIFPCVDYGHLVFPALATKCNRVNCIEVMIKYFRPEEWHFDFFNSKAKKRLYNFLDCLVTRITFGDQDFVRFVTDNDIIVPGMQNSSLESEVRNHMTRLISLLFTRQIKVGLFRSVFPCVNYGDLVFQALVERFSIPECREIMRSYFRPEEWYRNFNNPKAKDRLLSFWKGLNARITLKDWEFVTFVINSSLIPPIEQFFFDTPLIYQNLDQIIHSAIKHRMNPDLLQQIFPRANYGDLAFPAFLKASNRSHIREMMISYYRSESRCLAMAREMLSMKFISENQPPYRAGQRRLRNGRKYIIQRSKELAQYLKGEKRSLWYVFGALVRIQFIWMRQFSPVKRLGCGLVREVCSYLA